MNIQLIQHPEFGAVKTQVIKGEPWFVAKDVCEVLGITDTSQAVEKIEEDDKLIRTLYASGQNRDLWTVNESGLYNLVFQSRKPAARKFKRWVTSEVLPSLRKYGKYVMPGSVEQIRAQAKLDRKETLSMLSEIDYHLTDTDKRMIARKLSISTLDIGSVLYGRTEDMTILFECIERATRNANMKRKLRDPAVRRQIIAMLRGEDVEPLFLA